jgi:hypothetical protein
MWRCRPRKLLRLRDDFDPVTNFPFCKLVMANLGMRFDRLSPIQQMALKVGWLLACLLGWFVGRRVLAGPAMTLRALRAGRIHDRAGVEVPHATGSVPSGAL